MLPPWSSETLVSYITSRRQNPEDRDINLHRRENSKSRKTRGDGVLQAQNLRVISKEKHVSNCKVNPRRILK
jgi:hypothetical protein